MGTRPSTAKNRFLTRTTIVWQVEAPIQPAGPVPVPIPDPVPDQVCCSSFLFIRDILSGQEFLVNFGPPSLCSLCLDIKGQWVVNADCPNLSSFEVLQILFQPFSTLPSAPPPSVSRTYSLNSLMYSLQTVLRPSNLAMLFATTCLQTLVLRSILISEIRS